MQDFDKMYENMIADAVVPKRSKFSTYFAYRQGECKLFNTEDEAYNFSNLIEENLNEEAYKKAMQDYYEKEILLFNKSLPTWDKNLDITWKMTLTKACSVWFMNMFIMEIHQQHSMRFLMR